MDKKSVVVLGAGFGGLRAAMDVSKELRRLKLLDRYEIILVDRSDCHLFIPLLYKVAASPDPKHATNCTYNIGALIGGLPIRFVNAEISGLDVEKGDVRLKTGETLHADYLVVALGSETNFFGIPGITEYALQLKTLEQAMEIRDRITKAFTRAGQPGAAEAKIVVGGGGPNGVELAAEIRLWANRAQKENPNVHVSVSIVEAMPSLLHGFDATAEKMAAKRLAKLGVSTKFNAKITAVSENQVAIADEDPIPFDVFVWTGGIRTPELLTALPIAKDQHGKPLAKSDMACAAGTSDLQLAPMMYGVGDDVCFMDPKTGRAVPAVAHAAILEGRIAAHNIIAEIKRAEFASHHFLANMYRPGEYPYVIPIGEDWAVAKLGPFIFGGWLGWEFGRLVELNYLGMIMSPVRACKAWRRM